jgi:hypothetical protein
MTTSLPPCSRCGARPRQSPNQRWCQVCINQYKSERYWRLKALMDPRYEEVAPAIPAPPLAARPIGLCYLCRYAAWFEWMPGVWRCSLCGTDPALR